jgi:hypothetical protein
MSFKKESGEIRLLLPARCEHNIQSNDQLSNVCKPTGFQLLWFSKMLSQIGKFKFKLGEISRFCGL